MKHLGLFEGIGGFSLAAHWMGWETKAWVEKDEFCQKVLNKNFPNAKGYGDIRTFDGKAYRGTIDLITGGFPCQPFSTAGRRKGKQDDRYLWDEMLRVIWEVQPTWVVGENVNGILSMGQPSEVVHLESEKYARWMERAILPKIEKDLEEIGYSVQTFIIPACAVGAPHQRNRIWIIAHNDSEGKLQSKGIDEKKRQRTSNSFEDDTNSNGSGFWGKHKKGFFTETIGSHTNVTDSNRIRQSRSGSLGRSMCAEQSPEGKGNFTFNDRHFKRSWYKVATAFCRVDDGVSRQLDKYRSKRLKALGNAIVPQVAFEIFKAIQKAEY